MVTFSTRSPAQTSYSGGRHLTDGNVIGVNTGDLFAAPAAPVGIAFAIPSDVTNVVAQLNRWLSHARLGSAFNQPVTRTLRTASAEPRAGCEPQAKYPGPESRYRQAGNFKSMQEVILPKASGARRATLSVRCFRKYYSYARAQYQGGASRLRDGLDLRLLTASRPLVSTQRASLPITGFQPAMLCSVPFRRPARSLRARVRRQAQRADPRKEG